MCSTATLNCTILLAEDCPDTGFVNSKSLEQAGAKVTLVTNGMECVEEALKADAAGTPYDLILMDIKMPEMDGCTAAKTLREKGYTGIIVATSARSVQGEEEMVRHFGCDAYVDKLLGRDHMIQTLSEILANKRTPRS